MKHNAKIHLLPLMSELQRHTGKRRKDVEYAEAIGITRQAFVALLDGRTDGVKNKTINALLDFFHREGMPVAVGDLFTVTTQEQP